MSNILLDLLYPDSLYCTCCGKIIDETRTYRLCNDCMDGIKWAVGRNCNKCGKPLSVNNPGETCFSCREHAHIFRRGYTVAEYGTHERALVFSLKYHSKTDIARTIGEMMYDRLSAEFAAGDDGPDKGHAIRDRYDLLVPVPMYGPKKLARGFNQAELIARELARHAVMDYVGEVMERTRPTSAMKSMTPAERRMSIDGAFAVRRLWKDRIRGARVLVVDDIYTTGATADEMAATLLGAGAEFVDIISFAAGADVVK